MANKKFKIAMTGDRALDAKLKSIAADQGSRSINKEMRGATREAVKDIVKPLVLSQVPLDTGFLESQFTVKSIARSRSKLGSAIGFRDDLFRGDTFYAGFHEYGFHTRDGGVVYGDSFLRRPLYDSEGKIRSHVINRLKRWVGRLKGK
jgi:hypothetical protein